MSSVALSNELSSSDSSNSFVDGGGGSESSDMVDPKSIGMGTFKFIIIDSSSGGGGGGNENTESVMQLGMLFIGLVMVIRIGDVGLAMVNFSSINNSFFPSKVATLVAIIGTLLFNVLHPLPLPLPLLSILLCRM